MDDSEQVETTNTLTNGFEGAFHKLISRQVEVQSNEQVGAAFQLVTLRGESLKHRSWTPGDILQIAFPGWESRAYTPFAFDPVQGSAQLLGYVHGQGKGSEWLASASAGEKRFLLGPRTAVNLLCLERPLLVFGDETSFSTAAALKATPEGARNVQFVFEVNAIDDSREAVLRLGLGNSVTLIQRAAHEAHFAQIETRLHDAVRANQALRVLLTGAAPSIRHLYKTLRTLGLPRRQATNLAYWASWRKGFSGIQR